MELDRAERVFGPYIEIRGGSRGCIMKNFVINSLYQILVQLSNQGRGRVSCREKVENANKTFSDEARRVQNRGRHRNVMLKSI